MSHDLSSASARTVTQPIRNDVTEANNAGLTGTPSFLLGFVQPDATVKVAKKILGAKSYADFKAAIASLLAPAQPGTQ